MKVAFAFLFIAIILGFVPTNSAKECGKQSGCTSFSANLCAQIGDSNLCKRFAHECAYNKENCSSDITLSRVPLRNCANIAKSETGTCTSR